VYFIIFHEIVAKQKFVKKHSQQHSGD